MLQHLTFKSARGSAPLTPPPLPRAPYASPLLAGTAAAFRMTTWKFVVTITASITRVSWTAAWWWRAKSSCSRTSSSSCAHFNLSPPPLRVRYVTFLSGARSWLSFHLDYSPVSSPICLSFMRTRCHWHCNTCCIYGGGCLGHPAGAGRLPSPPIFSGRTWQPGRGHLRAAPLQLRHHCHYIVKGNVRAPAIVCARGHVAYLARGRPNPRPPGRCVVLVSLFGCLRHWGGVL